MEESHATNINLASNKDSMQKKKKAAVETFQVQRILFYTEEMKDMDFPYWDGHQWLTSNNQHGTHHLQLRSVGLRKLISTAFYKCIGYQSPFDKELLAKTIVKLERINTNASFHSCWRAGESELQREPNVNFAHVNGSTPNLGCYEYKWNLLSAFFMHNYSYHFDRIFI